MHCPTYSVGKYWLVFAQVLTLLAASGAQGADDAGTLTAARAGESAELDGKAGDKAWALARPLKLVAKRVLPPNLDASTDVELRAMYTATHLYILARWRDAIQDVSHKSWMWSSSKSAYEEGKDREDMFAVAFQHTGEFTADMLSGHDAVWDVWHWKAFRTNPQGYAMDKTHRYCASLPQGKAGEHTGYEDDTGVDSAKRYRIGVAAFDRTGDMDKASGLIVLDFAK